MSLDLKAIQKRHLDPEKNRGRTYYEGHIEVDLAALVEEVRHLRASLQATKRVRDDLRTKLNRLNEILINAHDLAGKAERAAVVKRLRREAEVADTADEAAGLLRAADTFERGEHRRKENE